MQVSGIPFPKDHIGEQPRTLKWAVTVFFGNASFDVRDFTFVNSIHGDVLVHVEKIFQQ